MTIMMNAPEALREDEPQEILTIQKLVTVVFNNGESLCFVDKTSIEPGVYSTDTPEGEDMFIAIANGDKVWPCFSACDLVLEGVEPVYIRIENKYPEAEEFVGLHRKEAEQKCLKHSLSYRVLEDAGKPKPVAAIIYGNYQQNRVTVWVMNDLIYRAEWC